jgi:hypothetical protein
MPLPSVEQFIGTNVTEQGFKDAQKELVEYVGNEVPKKADTDAVFATKANKATTLAGYGIADAYTKAQVDSSIAAVSGGHKAYQTLALAQAAQATLPVNSIVEITNDGANNGTYQWNGTTLTKSAYDPLTQAKVYTDAEFEAQSFKTQESYRYDFAVVDKFGRIGIYSLDGQDLVLRNIYLSGTIDVQTLGISSLTVVDDIDLLGTQINKGVGKDFFKQMNDSGQVLSKIDQYGNGFFNRLNCNAARFSELTVSKLNYKTPEGKKSFKYSNVLILSDGQSLGKGIQSSAISNRQLFNDVMFYGGCSIVTPTNLDSGQFSSYVPLTQATATSADGGLGEIPVQAATEMIHQLIDDKNGDLVFVGASNAVGGQTIDYLSTTAFDSYVSPCIDNALLLSNAQKSIVGLPAFFWTQGNSSASDTAYKSKLIALRQKYDTKAKATYNQKEDVRCIMYQFTNSGNVTTNQVAKATYEILKDNTANFTIACPDYHLPYSTDGIHLRAYGYKLLGAYYGIAYKKTVIDGEDFKPLYPIEFFRQGNLIQIKFHVPHGNLVLDTNTEVIRVIQNYGFDVYDSTGTQITINEVKIVGKDIVQISCGTAISSGCTVTYAWKKTKDIVAQNSFSGFNFGSNESSRLLAAGSLRDTQGDVIQFNIYTDQLPVNYKMHNWCIAFSETLA